MQIFRSGREGEARKNLQKSSVRKAILLADERISHGEKKIATLLNLKVHTFFPDFRLDFETLKSWFFVNTFNALL